MDLEAVQELEVEVEETTPQGYSAYEVAVQNGYEGTEVEWLASLKGADGATGAQGQPGANGQDGADATINGVNAINIVAGENITLDQEDGTLTINSTGGGTRDYADLTNKPSINNVTLNGNKSLSDLGAGTYDKPASGIPKTDLASDVQASLSKADTALQSETYTGTITGITMNGSSKGTSGIVDLGTVITQHQDISGKQDALTAGTNITIDENNVISATGGGSDLPIYTLETLKNIWESQANITSSNDPDAIARTNEIINTIYNSDKKYGGILLYSTATQYQYLFLLSGSIANNKTTFDFYSNTSPYYMGSGSSNQIFPYKKLSIYGSWDNDVFTCTSVVYTVPTWYRLSDLAEKSSVLLKSNSTAFTPTGDYNPATKKYVDDSIAAAITTTLGGSY